jgi:phage virion morphogenesis protein
MIDIQYNDDDGLAALRKLQKAAGNLSPALKEIGEDLQESTKQRFVSLSGPDGQAWPENSPVTLERKRGLRPLTDEGTLMDTINYQLLDNSTLAIGSPLEYAAMQQFGGSKSEFPHLWGDIPERPFLGISDDDRSNILDIVQSHLEASIR